MDGDKSRKQSIDITISPLINKINSVNSVYKTTSSCSGRIIIYEKLEGQKYNCNWLFVSHDDFKEDDIMAAIKCASSYTCVKFEPFILHCQCSTLQAADRLLTIAVACGFRESGISLGRKQSRIIVAVRSSQNMDIPICNDSGELLVSNEYLNFLTEIFHKKMAANDQKIQKFEVEVDKLITLDFDLSEPSKKTKGRQKTRPQVQIDENEQRHSSHKENDFDLDVSCLAFLE